MGAERLSLVVDGGTSNTRAVLFHGTELAARAARPVGVRDVAIQGRRELLFSTLSELVDELLAESGRDIAELDLLCASGMLTSSMGLAEVPHVVAPVGAGDLARHVVIRTIEQVAGFPLRLVPGVKTVPANIDLDNLAELDVMRGEEVETFGILEQTGRHGPLLILLPGSHTKLVVVDDQDRIAASYTTLAGEALDALAHHTVLADSVAQELPAAPPEEMVRDGMRFAERWGLLRSGFAVRLSDLFLGLRSLERTAFLLGAVVESDVGALLRSRHLAESRHPVLVAGRQPLRGIYASRLSERYAGSTTALEEATANTAAVRGALAVALRSVGSA